MAKPDESDKWHETLLTWGAYRTGYTHSHLGFGRTIYERMMSGLKGTTCGKCIGRGEVKVLVADAKQPINAPCPVCKGKGKVNVATRGKINPACIPATGGGTYHEEEPEIYGRIDKAMQKLTIRQRIVIISRYVRFPRLHDGERRVRDVNSRLAKIGEPAVSKQYLESRLLPDARMELRRYT